MKGIITIVAVVAVGAAGVWLWNKSHEGSDIEVPEDDLDKMLKEETEEN